MRFRGTDENGNEIDIPVKVKPADDHMTLYAHGAQGGFFGNYHFRIDFYQEMMPPLDFTEVHGSATQDDLHRGIDRIIVASVYLPVPFAKELNNWIGKNISQYEAQFGEIKLLAAFQSEESKEEE